MIVLIGSEKGGTGKTTQATNIAACLANRGLDVVLVDADPQGTSSRWKDRRDAYTPSVPTVHCVQKTGDLIRTLKDLSGRFQEVVVDAGGRDSKEFRSAMVVADCLYTPLRPSLPDIETMIHVNELVGQVKASINPSLRAFALISMAPSNPTIREVHEAREAIVNFDHFDLSPTIIRERVAYRNAFFEGLGVSDPSDKKVGQARAEIELLVAEIYGEPV